MWPILDNPQTDPETRIPYHDGEAGLPLVGGALHRLQLGNLPLRLLHKVTVAQPGHLIKQDVNERRKSVGKIVENENNKKKESLAA